VYVGKNLGIVMRGECTLSLGGMERTAFGVAKSA
jgi:hypothetical protein